MAITSLGAVEQFEVSTDVAQIASLVSRRTVYSLSEIEKLANRPTKIILFRLIGHFSRAIPYGQLIEDGIVTGPIQSIRKVSDAAFARILASSKR
ncbi:hypothetical protein PCO31111_05121 [Pandoraea communis]|uniref:Uncharacterized protein n=1 Tax=Pandoraea communis TaxID=2508297 RepID=A0A5E4Z5P3_9BURK|nr:hypothetical protein PCO31111_05121 [Pandoraea communis]